jgi:hypothetical protein
MTQVSNRSTDPPPRVFLSYSWSGPEHEGQVVALAERLTADGIHVVFDKWDLQEGQDKYAFMERTVKDPDVDRVLILSDRLYAEKADGRAGGVGTETQIISPDVYGDVDQRKFIAVVMERDPSGREYLPTYLRGRIYIDLSDPERFEAEYEKLLRNIYGKPLFERPPLGRPPAYLATEEAPSPLRHAFQTYRHAVLAGKPYSDALLEDFTERFVEAFSAERLEVEAWPPPSGEALHQEATKSIERFMPHRDAWIEMMRFVARYSPTESAIEIIRKALARVLAIRLDVGGSMGRPERLDDNLAFLLRELMLYTVAILVQADRLDSIDQLLGSPFYVPGRGGGNLRDFAAFDAYAHTFEERRGRRSSADADLHHGRAAEDSVSFEQMMEADLLLAARSVVTDADGRWCPKTLVLAESRYGAFPLFARCQAPREQSRLARAVGADNLDQVRDRIREAGRQGTLPLISGFGDSARRYLVALGLEEPGFG